MPTSDLGDSGHVRYVAKATTLDGWVVYGVRADGWHDRLAGNLLRCEAEARAANLTASVGAEGEHTVRGQNET